MTASTQKQQIYQALLNQLTIIHQVTIKAMKAKNLQNLAFIILNDTYHVIPYDLAVLWKITPTGPHMLGVSGQSTYTTGTDLANRWKEVISDLNAPRTPKIISITDFPNLKEKWLEAKTNKDSSVLWLPIIKEEKEVIALWLEKWEDPQGAIFQNNAKAVENNLIPGYALAWERLSPNSWYKRIQQYLNWKTLRVILPLLLLLLLFIRIPLRIVAPAEVVPKDSYIVTAPLNGIIAKVDIKPGQKVAQGDQLYEYDPRIPTQDLKVAEKEVAMAQSEINRATAASVEDIDQKTSTDLATLNIKLQKAQLDFAFAQSNFKELTGKAPISGVALIDNPDEWQGKPVKVGEKIMVIADPSKTKVRLWIPEGDNIALDNKNPVKVYLNTDPDMNYYIKLNYISHEAKLTDKHISSFEAEGDWDQKPPEEKLGVKGSAILYGEKVSLLYYILRKPLATLREFVGI